MLTTLTLLTVMAASDALPACPVVIQPPPPPPCGTRPCERGPWAQPPPPLRPSPLAPPVVIHCGGPPPMLRLWPPPRRRTRRPDPWPYHRESTPYVGVESGYLALFAPKDSAWRLLRPTAWVGGFFGWNFNPFIGLELGVGGSPIHERDDGLGGMQSVGVAAVSLDAKLRLIRPAPDSPIVPYLQAGLGAYWFGGKRAQPDDCGARGCLLAHGGAAHIGAGLDLYLTRGVLIGVRVLYRHLFLSGLHCPQGTPCAALAADEPRTQLPSLSATGYLTIFWSHL